MTMEDQHSWLTPLLRQPPPSALIVWEIDFGGCVASVKAHLGSFPQHRCSRLRHDPRRRHDSGPPSGHPSVGGTLGGCVASDRSVSTKRSRWTRWGKWLLSGHS